MHEKVIVLFFSTSPRGMETLEEKWKHLTLSDKESSDIPIEEDYVQEKSKKGLSSLVGKLHSERTVGKKVLKNTTVKVWRTSRPFSFIDICPNIFVVKFENQSDKNRVLLERPQLFDSFLFSLKPFDGRVPPTKMDFLKKFFGLLCTTYL